MEVENPALKRGFLVREERKKMGVREGTNRATA
jgi:hypothetical protein